ncbi:MAG: LamG domain-containing protein [Deltaproteobacteria bacterium]|nr:LamG domain-containing protein [Deltaproteobacteria bacterium]
MTTRIALDGEPVDSVGVTAALFPESGGCSSVYSTVLYSTYSGPVQPVADIKANGSDGPVAVPQGEPLSVTAALDPGSDSGKPADWWVLANASSGRSKWFTYDLNNGIWAPGLKPSDQKGLADLALTEVLSTSALPPGKYVFYFGVDLVMNGKVDLGDMIYDSVEVTVQHFLPRLIGHWDFEEGSGTTALDASGNLLHGSISNAGYSAGKVGNYALDFNGTDSYVEVPYNPRLNPDSVAISCWFKFRQQGGMADLLDKGHGTGTSPYFGGYALQADDAGTCVGGLYGNGAAHVGPGAWCGADDGQWHHMAVNLGAEGSALYVDGALVSEVPGEGAIVDNESPLYLGRHRAVGRYFNGLIDDLRIYDGPLSAAEIQALYDLGR